MRSVGGGRIQTGAGVRGRRPAVLGLLVAFVLVGPAAAVQESEQAGPPVAASIEVEPGRYTVGDPIKITLHLRYPDGYEIGAPAPGPQWGKLQVLKAEVGEPKRSKEGGWRRDDHLLCAAYSPGSLQVPPIPIAYKAPEGERGEVETPPLALVIDSVLSQPEEAEIADLKNPHSLPRAVWPWVAAAAGVLLAAGGLAYYLGWRRRRRLRALLAPRAELLLPPHQWALAELERLAQSGLLAEGRWLEYHILLAEVLKEYLNRRYDIPTLERTTTEIVTSMRASSVGSGVTSDLRALLEPCDLVKFARHEPARAEAVEVLGRARSFVEKTRPPEPQPEPAQAAG